MYDSSRLLKSDEFGQKAQIQQVIKHNTTQVVSWLHAANVESLRINTEKEEQEQEQADEAVEAICCECFHCIISSNT